MKIMKWVKLEREIEVEITTEDIEAALRSEPLGGPAVMACLNNIGQTMRAIGEKSIAAISPGARKTIHDFLIEQSARYCEIPLDTPADAG